MIFLYQSSESVPARIIFNDNTFVIPPPSDKKNTLDGKTIGTVSLVLLFHGKNIAYRIYYLGKNKFDAKSKCLLYYLPLDRNY